LQKLDAAVDGGMIHDAAGERLVGIGAKIEVRAQTGGNLRQVVLCSLHCGKSARAFERMFAGGEAGLGQQGRGVTVLGSAAGMKRLRHGAEHLTQAGRLRRCQPQRPDHALNGKAEQLADRRRGAEHSGGSGDVPASVVVRRIDRVPDARLSLETQDKRFHKFAAPHGVCAGVSK
jgi:hypothetical protein